MVPIYRACGVDGQIRIVSTVHVRGGGGYTDKKEYQNFLIYKEIQNGAVAKSYMTNGLIYWEIFAHLLIY